MRSRQGQDIIEIYNGFVLDDVHLACENIRAILKSINNTVGLNSDQYFDVRIIISELIQNAIKHGNESGSGDRKIYMKVFLKDEGVLNIIVRDQGSGFNANRTLQQEHNRQMCSVQDLMECGRGLQIVKSLSDSIMFNRKGNRITVLKKLF